MPVKIEAPEILKLRNMCHVLQAGKGKLQQAWAQVSDTVAELKAKEINHPDVDHAIFEVAGLLDKAALFLNELREQLPAMQSHKVDAEMAQTYIPEVEALTDKTVVHVDGLRQKLKDLKRWF